MKDVAPSSILERPSPAPKVLSSPRAGPPLGGRKGLDGTPTIFQVTIDFVKPANWATHELRRDLKRTLKRSGVYKATLTLVRKETKEL